MTERHNGKRKNKQKKERQKDKQKNKQKDRETIQSEKWLYICFYISRSLKTDLMWM